MRGWGWGWVGGGGGGGWGLGLAGVDVEIPDVLSWLVLDFEGCAAPRFV